MESDLKRLYFNDLAPEWDSFPTIADAPALIRAYVERSHHRRPDRILDVGCGTGILLPHLFELYPDVQLIVEMDYAGKMLVENARKYGDLRILHLQGDARSDTFVVPTFDLVLCFSALPHFGDPAPVLKGFLKGLRPGGVLTIGHMASSQGVNDFHHALDAPVRHDHLAPACELAETLQELGATAVVAEEEKDWFFVRGEKP